MPLTEYRRKRHFDRTAEPAGKPRARKKTGWRFVIQKHAASHLHYDFRLEHAGVLKSWAVPHGPSLDPTQRRLAVEVEDHPIEYGNFEGIIPEGEYGGGTVLLWDSGTWSSEQDVDLALATGKLRFQLDGEKLSGGWTLVRMRAKPGEKRHNWLLIKERDAQAQPLAEFDVLEERPQSVSSGRTIGEIAADPKRSWTSNRSQRSQPAATRQARGRRQASARRPAGGKLAALPNRVEPQLATLVAAPPAGDNWLHEIKLDGYRIISFVDHGEARLVTRNHNDWTRRFPEIAESLAALEVRQAILDGEVVALLDNGASDFQALQTALSEHRTSPLVYFVFDLLYLDGVDLRSLPLEERKEQLTRLLARHPQSRIRYSGHVVGRGKDVVARSCRLGLEGIVSKRREGAYSSGRSDAWLKTKCSQRQEFVIGGFTDSESTRRGLGALLVGYFNKAGGLVYAGKVGTGFSLKTEQDLKERLKAREQSEKSFVNAVKDERRASTHWVRPELLAEVQYSNWTEAGHLRHPSFQGLREDKPATEVVLERSTPKRAAKSKRSRAATGKKTPRKPPRAEPVKSLSTDQLKELDGLKLTHPERVVYPDLGLTKLDLVSYYAEVSEWMLPHVANRPLSLVRCPTGQTGHCFYQKHASAGTPAALQRVVIQEKDKAEEYLVIHSLAGLLSLIQMGVLEIHPWGSTLDDIEKPDRLIFDLDPDPAVAWPDVITAARELKDRLGDLGLKSFPKTSGGKGLHLVVPIQRRTAWPQAKQFCRAIAMQMAKDSPRRFTANMSKAQRHGKIYIDYLRNDRGATAIAPYSTRSRPGAPVATPLGWREVTPRTRSDQFGVQNVPDRLTSLKADPWEELPRVKQSLTRELLRRVVGG